MERIKMVRTLNCGLFGRWKPCRQNNMVAWSNILISKRIGFSTHISRPENEKYFAG